MSEIKGDFTMKSIMKTSICACAAFLLSLPFSAISNAGSLDFTQISPSDKAVTYERIIMQNKQQRELGTNGAGCQWPVSLESSNDGSLMLYGIDVAGLYKSTDHGETWTMAVSGIGSRGVGMFAIDPKNANHVLALGLGTSLGAFYVSYDKAETWKKTASMRTNGSRYLWDGLEFDPTSSQEGISTDVYFSTPYKRDTSIRNSSTTAPSSYSVLKEDQVGLYRSEDGGETFSLIINDARLADGIVKITDAGDVYVGSQHGLFLINKDTRDITESYFANDGAANYSKGITGLDVVGNTIYAQTWDGIYKLEKGQSPEKFTNDETYLNVWPQFLEVSKKNPDHMIYQVRSNKDNYYVSKPVVSFDGGQTWQYSETDRNALFFRSNWEGREKLFIIDPSDDDNVITFGSDNALRSTDGGLNFNQAKGISNMMQGGRFNFNYYDPDLLLFSAQDYTGVISTDGGETYRALPAIPGKGHFYGGFAADEATIYGFANASWNGGTLTYTHDGGDTWVDTGLTVSGVPGATYYSSLQSPTNPNVLFAAEYYSKDKGYTWEEMDGCVSVFTFNYTGDKELYGADGEGNIVVSYDNGDTWSKLSDITWYQNPSAVKKQTILDLAYDQVNNCAYLVVQSTTNYTVEEIYKYDISNKTSTKLNIPVDNSGAMRQKTVAVDPNSTSVVYIGGAGDYFSSKTALLRSIDGGANWSVLTTGNDENYPAKATNQGGYEVATVRVNPRDGRVWIACGCYGYETCDPPYAPLKPTAPENHTITYMYQDKQVHQAAVKNNGKHNYVYEEDGLSFVNWYKDEALTQEFPNGSSVYGSMTLYAKMEKSVKVKFYDRNRLLWKIDLDAYDKGSEAQIPKREGYVFAGWYSDSGLTTVADFSKITSDTSVYAGWYKVLGSVFDIGNKDLANYINYTDKRLQAKKEVDNDQKADDRCIQATVEKNSTYFITFKMDTRFRLGMFRWELNQVDEPSYIDERDVNGTKPINEYVRKTINTGDTTRTNLLVHYYSWDGTRDFMDIKRTFGIYKIDGTDVTANNQEIEGIRHTISEGANQTYTIHEDDAASYTML